MILRGGSKPNKLPLRDKVPAYGQMLSFKGWKLFVRNCEPCDETRLFSPLQRVREVR